MLNPDGTVNFLGVGKGLELDDDSGDVLPMKGAEKPHQPHVAPHSKPIMASTRGLDGQWHAGMIMGKMPAHYQRDDVLGVFVRFVAKEGLEILVPMRSVVEGNREGGLPAGSQGESGSEMHVTAPRAVPDARPRRQRSAWGRRKSG